jgi:hypothetical protein
MQAKFIDYGTQLEIRLVVNGAVTEVTYSGLFYNTVGDLVVMIEGEEFFNYCAASWPGFQMEIVFFTGGIKHFFRAEYMDTTVVNYVNLVRVRCLSPVEDVSLRSLPRVTVSVTAKVYITTDTNKEYVFDALTENIALNSISLFSTFVIPPGETPEIYSVALTLRKSSFILPVKLLRTQPTDDDEKFRNKYVFLIDFDDDKEMKDNLLFALFDYRKHIN